MGKWLDRLARWLGLDAFDNLTPEKEAALRVWLHEATS